MEELLLIPPLCFPLSPNVWNLRADAEERHRRLWQGVSINPQEIARQNKQQTNFEQRQLSSSSTLLRLRNWTHSVCWRLQTRLWVNKEQRRRLMPFYFFKAVIRLASFVLPTAKMIQCFDRCGEIPAKTLTSVAAFTLWLFKWAFSPLPFPSPACHSKTYCQVVARCTRFLSTSDTKREQLSFVVFA